MNVRRAGYAGYDTLTHELATADHYPSCPGCGNLCGRLARVCADCGARLVLNESETRTLGLAEAAIPVPKEGL